MAEIFLKRGELAGGRLPRVCVLCGKSGARDRDIHLQYQPYWWMTMFTRVSIIHYQTTRLPVCDGHGFYFYRGLIIGLGGFAVLFFGVILIMLLAVATQSGIPVLIGVAFFFLYVPVWIGTLLFLRFREMRPTQMNDRGTHLVNVSEKFVRAVKNSNRSSVEISREGKRRRQAPNEEEEDAYLDEVEPADVDDEDEDDRPRRRGR